MEMEGGWGSAENKRSPPAERMMAMMHSSAPRSMTGVGTPTALTSSNERWAHSWSFPSMPVSDMAAGTVVPPLTTMSLTM